MTYGSAGGHRIVRGGGSENLLVRNLVRNSGRGGRQASERCFGSLECDDDRMMCGEEQSLGHLPGFLLEQMVR